MTTGRRPRTPPPAPPSTTSAPPATVTQRSSTSTSNTTTGAVGVPTPGVSPYIASTESLHPFIQYELIKRTKASEMATVYMPFVKLTSLSSVLGDNLENLGERCTTGSAAYPSLGIHGEQQVSFDDIYTPIGKRSIVGYARVASDTPGRVPVLVTQKDAEKDPPNIPIPGIVSMTTERTTAGSMGIRGGLFKATINIKAYSTGQVNVLLRYFLRPATRVILELGHRSATNIEDTIKSQNSEYYQKFDWDRPLSAIDAELEPLVTLKKGQREFIEKYIYKNFGNYEIFIGYVVDFKLKYNKDNTYEISLIIHSLQQYEVPLNNTGVQGVNQGAAVPDKCKTIEIKEYFKTDAGYRENSFVKLIENATTNGLTNSVRKPLEGENWKDHVISLRGPGASPGAGGNENPGYLVSWQFFVDVILNDLKYGILSVFQLDPTNDINTLQYLQSSVLRAIGKVRNEYGTLGYADGEFFENPLVSLESNEVGWSPSLRSTDPSVMVIYNNISQNNSVEDDAREIAATISRTGVVQSDEEVAAIAQGFQNESIVKTAITTSTVGPFIANDRGTAQLTSGVWLNTNAIIQAFEGTDILSVAINNLLTMMNNATRGFWNLQLLSNDTEAPGLHVIDAGLSKPILPPPLDSDKIFNINILNTDESNLTIDSDIKKLGTLDAKSSIWKPTYLYVFNKAVKSRDTHDTGGELLDISLESSLPQVVAVQAIAGIGGQMQRGTLQAIDINELRKINRFNVYPKSNCQNGDKPCGDPNNNVPKRPNELPESVGNQIKNLIANGPNRTTLDTQAQLTKSVEDYVKKTGICPEPPEGGLSAQQTKRCEEEKKKIQDAANLYTGQLQAIARQAIETDKPGYLDMVGKYASKFGAVLDFIEYDLTKFVKNLDEDSAKKDIQIHPFNSSNLTKTTVDLTMPGLGGLQLFQAFSVARTPSILDKGYYVITKVAHDFSTDNGWTTKVQGRFRYNPNFTINVDNQVKSCGDEIICQEAPARGTR